jgi:hypothetical protein
MTILPRRRPWGLRRRPRRPDQDRGSVLLLTMVLTLVLSTVAAALAGYAAVSLRATQVTENRADQLAAADAAIRYAVEKLRLRQTLCTTSGGITGLPVNMADPLNDATVSVTCRRLGSDIGDIQGWAAVITGIGLGGNPGLTALAGAGKDKLIGGPAYVFDQATIDLSSPVKMEQGDMWYRSSDCAAPVATPANLSFDPPEVRGMICTDKEWHELFKPPAPPALPPAAPPYQDISGCRVFFPGTYTAEPDIDQWNYFVSGDYYFQNIGNWEISHATVIGGARGGPPVGDLESFIPQGKCSTIGATIGDLPATTNTGVTWVFGGNTSIQIGTQGALELHRRGVFDGTGKLLQVRPSVVAVPAVGDVNYDAGWGAFQPSTLTAMGTPILETKSGGVSDLVAHSMVWAPKAGIVLGNVTNDANGQLLGGVVIARLELQASASAEAFNVRVETTPAKARLLITATASTGSGAATRVQSVIELRQRQDLVPGDGINEIDEVAVAQWRVCATATTTC